MANILDTISNTPLIKIQKINPNKRVNIFAKLEGFNPTGSIKDRIALWMVKEAEKKRILKRGKIIVEASSGNTGISLAMVGKVKGYKVKIVMPKFVTIERRKIIKAFGADLVLVEEYDEAIEFTKNLVKKNRNYVFLNQYENKANIKAHYYGTAVEILKQMRKKIDAFVAGIGTGGTITGIGKRLKEKYPKIKIFGVCPKLKENINGLKSIKKGFVPKVLDLNLIDEIIEVGKREALETMKEIIKKEGIFVGLSSGAIMFATKKIAKKMKDGNIVVIFPDRGEKYLTLLQK